MKRFELDYTTTLYVDCMKNLQRVYKKLKHHNVVFIDSAYRLNCNIGSTRVYGMLIGKLGGGQYSVKFIPGDEVLAELLGLQE